VENKDKYRPSCGVPEPRIVPRGEGFVYIVPRQGRREFVPRGVPPKRDGGRCVGFGCGEFARHYFTHGKYKYGGTIAALRPRGATIRVRVVLQGDVWVFHLGEIGWILRAPLLSK
jgi:hypothetical protein